MAKKVEKKTKINTNEANTSENTSAMASSDNTSKTVDTKTTPVKNNTTPVNNTTYIVNRSDRKYTLWATSTESYTFVPDFGYDLNGLPKWVSTHRDFVRLRSLGILVAMPAKEYEEYITRFLASRKQNTELTTGKKTS